MTKDFGTFLIGITYLAILFLLVRPKSNGPALIQNVASGLTNLIQAGTGGGGWSGTGGAPAAGAYAKGA